MMNTNDKKAWLDTHGHYSVSKSDAGGFCASWFSNGNLTVVHSSGETASGTVYSLFDGAYDKLFDMCIK